MKQKTAKNRMELDFTQGSIIKNLLTFALPLMASNILQLLFNAADMIVVSLDSDTAMGSIGATSSLTNVILQTFIGLGVGAGVVMARCYGAKNQEYANKVLHTSIILGLLSGISVGLIGLLFSGQILRIMGTPEQNLEMATQYLTIYFLGAPFNLVLNFGASIMRSVGDTKRPLIYLTIAGVLNVIVNLITVLGFGMGVVGVALATIAAQVVACSLVIISLMRNKSFFRLSIKELKINAKALKDILRVGIPSGVQSAVFSLSNTFIQSAVNSFDTVYVNGNSAAANIEGFVYTLINASANSVVTAVGQNYGARNFARIKKSVWIGFAFTAVVAIVSGAVVLLLFQPIASLYVEDQTSREVAFRRALIIISPYGLCGIMEIISGTLRGIGYSFVPMIMVIIGTCVVRIVWIFCVFPLIGEYEAIFVIFPISWAATGILLGIMLIVCLPKKQRAHEIEVRLMRAMKKSAEI